MPSNAHLRQPATQRFWQLVDKSNGPIHPIHGRCWIWIGAIKDKRMGYGIFVVSKSGKDEVRMTPHRFSWLLHFGSTDLCVLHKCDNGSCVNPAHLFVGTRKQNTADRQSKDRQAKGEKHAKAILTEAQVISIRQFYKKGTRGRGIRIIAQQYGVARNTIEAIVTGKTWKHLLLNPRECTGPK